MTNRMKAKGDKYERDILAICHQHGFTSATRTRPGRMEDQGDIFVAPGIIAQCKDVATPQWRDWLEELTEQTRRARAATGFLVVKRRGVGGRPPLHLAVVPLEEMLRLVDAARSSHSIGPAS